MTVAELIAALHEMPADALVVVDGYEDGWDDPGKVHTRQLVDEQGEDKGSWWSGRYDSPSPSGEDKPILEVVVIPR